MPSADEVQAAVGEDENGLSLGRKVVALEADFGYSKFFFFFFFGGVFFS